MEVNPFKDIQSDKIQRSSRKIFTVQYVCRNADLNLTIVTWTINGFLFEIINSLIESSGVRLTCIDCKINAETLFKRWTSLSLADPDRQGRSPKKKGFASQFGLNTKKAWAPGSFPGSANGCYYDAMYYSILWLSSSLTQNHDNS